MRLQVTLAFLLAFIAYPFGSNATNIVTNKVILEIQPEREKLGDYFSPANDVLSGDGYTFLKQLWGTNVHGSVTMQEIGGLLEAGSYGILEYGGHGSAEGCTSGETFATYQQAEDERKDLIKWMNFDDGELEIVSRDSYYALALTPTYTNSKPIACDVAFISTCYGDAAGSFNASCKVAGTGNVTSAQLIASFSCLISWLEDPTYGTIDLAATKCTADNPTSWMFTVTNGDWQLLTFDNPAATVYGFSVSGGVARWRVTSQYETENYVVEGAPGAGGPWQPAAVEPPTVGNHDIDVAPYSYYRLLEIEDSGGRLIHGIAMDTPPVAPYAAQPPAIDDLRSRISELRTNALELSNSVDGGASPDTMLIVTTDALIDVSSYNLADYWRLRGAEVQLLSVEGFDPDPNIRRTQLHTAIVDAIADGVGCVLFVGDANDHVQFDMEKEGPQWWPEPWEGIHAHYIAAGFPPGGQPANDLIPAWYEPDTLPRGQNTAYILPYVPSLCKYVDVDGDDIPDVPWGCLPFTTEEEILGYACKLWSLHPTESGAGDVTFYVCDRDYEYAGDGANAKAAADEVESALPTWVTRHHLYVLDVPNDASRNTAAADLWNGSNAGIHILMGSYSNRYMPADFFDKTNSVNPWHMGMLIPQNNYYPLVIANSCSGGDWVRTEDPVIGTPILEDFLASHDRGAFAWIGPPVGTWQHANTLFGKYLIEELYADPARSMAASFLIAQRRVLEDPTLKEPTKLVARMMCFFGDPLAPLNELTSITNAESPQPSLPFALYQNVPNPFNPATTIQYSIAEAGHVKLNIYNAAGQKIRTLVDAKQAPRSEGYSIVWNGRNDTGQPISSGVYFCQLRIRGLSQTKKIVLLK